MKARDLRVLPTEELENKLKELKKQLMELNFQRKTAKVEKPHLFKQIRKDIARILTILNERRKNA